MTSLRGRAETSSHSNQFKKTKCPSTQTQRDSIATIKEMALSNSILGQGVMIII
jgi:hypothetical protein